MAEPTAPTNQWREPHAQKIGGRAALRYPIFEDGAWGWTDRLPQADGIIVLEDGTLGVDDYETTGGLRAFALNGEGPFFAVGG